MSRAAGMAGPSRHESQSLTATQKALQDSKKALQDSAAIANPLNDTPEQIETFKRNRRETASRGSSGIVLPTPLPGPTHYGRVGTPAAPLRSVEQPGPTILPSSAAPFRTCRMGRRRSRIAPRAAPSSPRSTTSMPASSAATWEVACSRRPRGTPKSISRRSLCAGFFRPLTGNQMVAYCGHG